MDDELFHSALCVEDDSRGSDLGVEGVEESSEEEADEEDELNLEESYLMDPGTSTGKDGQMIESYDKRELISAPEVVEAEPYDGMEFESKEAALEFYGSYAERSGFKARVSKCSRSANDGLVISRRFVCCSKQGHHLENGQLNSTQQEVVPEFSCMARLVVKKLSSGKWEVTEFQREHNHETMGPRGVDLKPHLICNITEAEDLVEDMESPSQERESVPIQVDPSLEPRQGMEFLSEEAARLYYNEYAKDLGFTVRISKCRRARDGSIICRRFVCSKEGYYVRKHGRTKRSRALTRVGCMARLVVKKMDSGVWVVSNFEREHNHPPFVTGKELNYLPPNPTRRSGSCGTVLESSSRPVISGRRLDIQNNQNSIKWRFNKLHEEGIKFAEEAASSVEIFNIAMSALQEATEKVIAAKKSIALDTHNGHNQGISRDNNGLMNDLKNKTRKDIHGSSNNFSQGTDQGELIQHPVDPVCTTLGLHNQFGEGPVSINTPNCQGLLKSTDGHVLNITVSVPHLMMTSAQNMERFGSTSESVSASGKRSQLLEGSATEQHSKGKDSHSQGCEIFTGSRPSTAGPTANQSISNAQVAALQAVAEAFNVPTTGATSSSAVPIEVSPVSREFSKACRRSNPGPHGISKDPSGPNPLVHAAAIAAGARIVPPAVAASLMKAVQSRPAIHIRSGGFIPKLPIRTRELSSSNSIPNDPPHHNSHEICPKDPPREAQTPVRDNHTVYDITDASSDFELSMDTHHDFLNLKAGDDWMLQVVGNHNMDEQLYTGSSST